MYATYSLAASIVGDENLLRVGVAPDASGQERLLALAHKQQPKQARAMERAIAELAAADELAADTDGVTEQLTFMATRTAHERKASEGRAIANVTFASFGTPAGECAFDGDGGGDGFAATSCNDPASRATVAAACAIGEAACVVPTAGFARADACGDANLWLAVELECA